MNQQQVQGRPLVSIVTPFHNTAQYLPEAIQSVLNQVYPHWEYILVNNCSDDGSREIAETFAALDERIRLIHSTDFLNQVENYNFALRQIDIKSKYCKIVQADDFIYPECVGKMVELAESDVLIGVVSSYRLEGKIVSSDGLLEFDQRNIDGREVCRSLLKGGPFVFGSPTSVMYRSDIVRSRHHFYPEFSMHEDTEVCYEILKTNRFGFIHEVLSYSRLDDDSISGSAQRHSPPMLDGLIVVKKYALEFLDAEESKRLLHLTRRDYYRFLALNLFRSPNRDFWSYQITGLKMINERISYGLLIKSTLLELLDLLLNPKMTIERVLRKIVAQRKTRQNPTERNLDRPSSGGNDAHH